MAALLAGVVHGQPRGRRGGVGRCCLSKKFNGLRILSPVCLQSAYPPCQRRTAWVDSRR
jgi:hypothetical protein